MRLIDADTIFNNKVLVVKTECYDAVRAVIERINNAPTVDAVPLEDYRSMEQTVNKLTKALADAEPVKHGYWNEHKDYPGLAYLCSECGYFTTDRSYYCPYCGAKMEVEDAN